MPDENAGTAESLDAEVSTEVPAVSEDDVKQAEAVVEAAQRKIDRQNEHLAGAQASHAAAVAALAALRGVE